MCTHNRAKTLSTTLSSFSEQIVPPNLSWELIVVDNRSSDNTRDLVESFARNAPFPVRYLFEGTLGKSMALNTGVSNAYGDIVAFTDDDVFLHPEWLTTLNRDFEEFGCIGIGGRVIPVWTQPKPEWLEMKGQQAIVNFDLGEEPTVTTVPPLGANCAFRKSVFAKYGLFRADLGPAGDRRGMTCEDTEFAQRVIRGHEKIVYSPRAIVYHPVAPHRTTKAFFQTWYYYDGRSSVRANQSPDNSVHYFGIPRWMYRGALANGMLWMLSCDSKQRFQYKLSTYRGLGRMVEAFQLAHAAGHRGTSLFRKLQRS